ncbi:MAG TPA: hypothetical protein PK054_00180 [Anaerohalosphaeraceae bacterium]|nr:hypothetical protein [Anaerohalosphaeraceae bacterium]
MLWMLFFLLGDFLLGCFLGCLLGGFFLCGFLCHSSVTSFRIGLYFSLFFAVLALTKSISSMMIIQNYRQKVQSSFIFFSSSFCHPLSPAAPEDRSQPAEPLETAAVLQGKSEEIVFLKMH